MRGVSAFNAQEATLVLRLVCVLCRIGIDADRIGVITPYRGQVRHIQSIFRSKLSTKTVHVGTVDAFQGGERDIIVVSTVCAGKGFPCKHDTQAARLNVTISRARHHLVIIG